MFQDVIQSIMDQFEFNGSLILFKLKKFFLKIAGGRIRTRELSATRLTPEQAQLLLATAYSGKSNKNYKLLLCLKIAEAELYLLSSHLYESSEQNNYIYPKDLETK